MIKTGHNKMSKAKSAEGGYLLVLVLVLGATFFVMLTAFMGFVITQSRVQDAKYNRERALDIAEAGLNYYKWFLAHYPGDTTNGTAAPGPYVHTYADPEGADIGEFSLEIGSSTACGELYAIDITSTGHTYDEPGMERIVYGRYAQPTVAEYAYIIDSNVWAGPDRTITGPYFSNGIIRMDGTNNSTVSSGQENWTCDDSELSCDPYNDGDTVDAVYGDGPNSDLWSFPDTPVDFGGISADLAVMQDKAMNSGGLYVGPSSKYGYQLEFNSDGTVDVYTAQGTYNYYGYSSEDGWAKERYVIQTVSFVSSYEIPASCSIIYVEDNVWIKGEVKGRVTVAAADVDTTGVDPRVILNGDITYADDESGLLVIAEDDVLVGLDVPDDMELNGIFIAQNGHFGRNHYCVDDCSYQSGNQGLPGSLDQYVTRNSLTVNGTIVSDGRVGTKWTSGGVFSSGFETRYNYYDRNLVDDPPPLTPNTSDTYEFIEWLEVE